jgi:hypothetical protein
VGAEQNGQRHEQLLAGYGRVVPEEAEVPAEADQRRVGRARAVGRQVGQAAAQVAEHLDRAGVGHQHLRRRPGPGEGVFAAPERLPIRGVGLEARVEPACERQQRLEGQVAVAWLTSDRHLQPVGAVAPGDGGRRERLGPQLPEHDRHRPGHEAAVAEAGGAQGPAGAEGAGGKGDAEVVHAGLRVGVGGAAGAAAAS